MKSLEHAARFSKDHPGELTVEAEIKYFAIVRNVRYELTESHERKELDRKEWTDHISKHEIW